MSGWLLCAASRFDDFVLAENLTGLLSSEGRLNFFAGFQSLQLALLIGRALTARKNLTHQLPNQFERG